MMHTQMQVTVAQRVVYTLRARLLDHLQAPQVPLDIGVSDFDLDPAKTVVAEPFEFSPKRVQTGFQFPGAPFGGPALAVDFLEQCFGFQERILHWEVQLSLVGEKPK